jgi:hypothetical protein
MASASRSPGSNPAAPRVTRGNVVLLVFAALWVTGVAAGFRALWVFSGTSGAAGAPSNDWPSDSALPRHAGHATLLMFLHPRCPCSRASLNELDRLLTSLEGKLEATVGVSVAVDEGGREASRFGAETSGYCVVYAANGTLLFRGGITAARAHEGENVGSERIVSLVTTGHSDREEAAVFGCGLKDPG